MSSVAARLTTNKHSLHAEILVVKSKTLSGISFSRCLQYEDYYHYIQWNPEVAPPFFTAIEAVNRNGEFLLTQFHQRYVNVA